MRQLFLSFFTTFAIMMLPLVVIHYSLKSQGQRALSLAEEDFALWQVECKARHLDPCSQRLLERASSVAGVLLGAAERKAERGGALTDTDKTLIRENWRSAYTNESNGSIYSHVANACTDALGDRCPDFFEIASWKHSERLMAVALRDPTP